MLNREAVERYYRRLRMVYQKPEIAAPVEVILSVFVSLFLVMTAIRPTLVTVTELKKKITDQEQVEKKLDVKITKLIGAAKQLEEFNDSLVLFEKAVPKSKTYGDLAKKIELVAIEQNVAIESMSFSSVVILGEEETKNREWVDGGAKVKEFSVNFSVLGGEMAVENFLREIENLDRVTVISTVELVSVKKRDSLEKKIKASGEINSYYLMKTKI